MSHFQTDDVFYGSHCNMDIYNKLAGRGVYSRGRLISYISFMYRGMLIRDGRLFEYLRYKLGCAKLNRTKNGILDNFLEKSCVQRKY